MRADLFPQAQSFPSHRGHAHFWQRALGRRNAIKTAVGATGAVLSSGLWLPALAEASVSGPDAPTPIPGVVAPGAPFHVELPGPDNEPSSINNFNGFIGIANIDGTGKGNDGVTYLFDVDIRFMQGLYVGADGQNHQGTFGFF